VRTPLEIQQTGRIPTALNIPITTSADAFFISEEEFEERFGFERPGKDDEVVFYCKSGVRSRGAAEIARSGGWTRVGEFEGSWLEWEGKGGEIEK
jgi:3-mercaptopyruvate sulfurtransferase SseA